MIRAYTVSRKKLQSGDIVSSNALKKLRKRSGWLWIDGSELEADEISVISDFTVITETGQVLIPIPQYKTARA